MHVSTAKEGNQNNTTIKWAANAKRYTQSMWHEVALLGSSSTQSSRIQQSLNVLRQQKNTHTKQMWSLESAHLHMTTIRVNEVDDDANAVEGEAFV